MTLDFSAYPKADDALKERTKKFFRLISYPETTNAVLVKLVKEGICTEVRGDDRGKPALATAAGCIRTEVVQALLASGAKVDARDNEGLTALATAAWNGRTGTVQTLLAAGANIETRSDKGYTPLILATQNNFIETTQILIAARANIEARSKDGYTPLIMAAGGNGSPEMVKILKAVGANLEPQDNLGKKAGKGSFNNEVNALLKPAGWHSSYANFVKNGTAPQSAAEIYQLLVVTPLMDPSIPVDYAGNIRKIFAHAQWPDKEQAADILTQMKNDGRINAETADSIMSNSFPGLLHAPRLQHHANGMTR